MAAVIHLPQDPTSIANSISGFGAGLFGGLQNNIEEQKKQKKILAIQEALDQASNAPDRNHARQILKPLVEDSSDALRMEQMLNDMFPQEAADLVDFISENTGGLVRTSQGAGFKDPNLRAAPVGTKLERFFEDAPQLTLAGEFATGSQQATNYLTKEEHELKYGSSKEGGGKTLDPKVAAEARARIRSSNRRNSKEKPLQISSQETFDQAILLANNDNELKASIDDNFKKTFGIDANFFAEEDLPIRNRALAGADDLVLRQGMSITEAAEAAVAKAVDEITDEEMAKIEERKLKDGKTSENSGLLQTLQDKLAKPNSPDAPVAKDPDAPQASIKYVMSDGTPTTVDIPTRINLAAADGAKQLYNFLVSEKKFSKQEARAFIEANTE